MIEKTVFTKEEVKDVMKTNYNIVVNHVEKLNPGSANVYSLNGNKYILKELQFMYIMHEIFYIYLFRLLESTFGYK